MRHVYKALLIFAFILLPLTAHAKDQISKEEFTKNFFSLLNKEMPNDEFQILGDLRIKALDIGGGNELTIFLDNAYLSYLNGERDINDVFLDRLSSIKNKKLSFSDDDINSILPVLKPTDYLEGIKQQIKEMGGDADALPIYYEQLNDDLIITYVFDTPSSMRSTSPEFVKDQKLEQTIRKLASENLDVYYKDKGVQFNKINTQGNGTVFQFVSDKNYEASIVASLSFWKTKRLNVNGDLVVFVPSRDLVYLVGSNDTKAIQFMTNLVTDNYEKLSYSISPYPYYLSNGKWLRFNK